MVFVLLEYGQISLYVCVIEVETISRGLVFGPPELSVIKMDFWREVGCFNIHYIFSRDVTKISSCQVKTTSRRGIKQLRISFGSIFLL